MKFEKFAKKNEIEKLIAKVKERKSATREELENIIAKYKNIVDMSDIKAFTSTIGSFEAMGIKIEELDGFNYEEAKTYVEKRLLENLIIVEEALKEGIHPKSFDYWLKYIQEKANIAKPLLYNLTYAYTKIVVSLEKGGE